ncbi:cation:dicarboxylase symporter family transporter [Parvimonas sp. D2]|uniref:cation:dicarboxylate symporter family transporter n=1 Tax=unclassified Parvimonas TaxID=1151464 RepID=UPI002B479CC6|nr:MULTISPECIES: cation:dicarboxylase symporter family transporter [unclassified Parvimonas]MEB3011966.1 cation:dicarboxylase symporter family transporter [Parvimonas sp. D2]
MWLTKIDITTYVKIVSPFGQVLVAMLKMIVIPVIFLSLIDGAASVPTKEFGKVKTLLDIIDVAIYNLTKYESFSRSNIYHG